MNIINEVKLLFIGVSLSEPHIISKAMRELYFKLDSFYSKKLCYYRYACVLICIQVNT